MSEQKRLTAWRLVKAKYAAGAFDGEGAFRFGGRWNSKGVRVVYASESLSLAALEWLVHLDPAAALPELVAFRLQIPVASIVDIGEVDPDYASMEETPLPTLAISRQIGDRWVKAGLSTVLRVPSAVIPVERNFVLNPAHPHFSGIQRAAPQEFTWDQRLI